MMHELCQDKNGFQSQPGKPSRLILHFCFFSIWSASWEKKKSHLASDYLSKKKEGGRLSEIISGNQLPENGKPITQSEDFVSAKTDNPILRE